MQKISKIRFVEVGIIWGRLIKKILASDITDAFTIIVFIISNYIMA